MFFSQAKSSSKLPEIDEIEDEETSHRSLRTTRYEET
jgi:hypothetical protein